MRNPSLVAILLVVLGLVPVGVWIAFAANLEPSGLGRSIGRAILVLFSPVAFGGVLMIGAGAFFQRAYLAPRIVATIGTTIVLVGALFIAVAWARRFANCGPSDACSAELVQLLLMVLYAAVHVGAITMIWRVRQ